MGVCAFGGRLDGDTLPLSAMTTRAKNNRSSQRGTAPASGQGPPAGHAGCPSPLEVVSAQPSRHVDRFTDEMQTFHLANLHTALVQFVGIDTAAHHFSLTVASRSVRHQAPVVNAISKRL